MVNITTIFDEILLDHSVQILRVVTNHSHSKDRAVEHVI